MKNIFLKNNFFKCSAGVSTWRSIIDTKTRISSSKVVVLLCRISMIEAIRYKHYWLMSLEHLTHTFMCCIMYIEVDDCC